MILLKISNQSFVLCIFLVFACLLLSPSNVQAEIIWSDNFDDDNLDDWDVWGINWTSNPILPSNASMIVEAGVLKSNNTKPNFWAYACHESNNTQGTWSFDWLPATNQRQDFVSFISDINETDWINVTEFYSNTYFLWLNTGVSSSIPGIDLHKHVGTNLNIKVESHYTGDISEDWHHIDISRDNTGLIKIYLDDVLVINAIDNDVTESELFCFSTSGDAQYDNIVVKDTPISDEPSNPWLVFFIGLLTASGIGYFSIKLLRPFFHRSKYEFNKSVISHLSEILDNRPYLFYLIIGDALTDSSKIEGEVRQRLPVDILNFKFLLNPIRLTITKLLYENVTLSSIEIRDLLQISWGTYSTHFKALKKNGYISATDEFRDGSLVQVLTLQQKGISEFSELTDLLLQFLSHADDSDPYLRKQENTFEWLSDKFLYPVD
ncbi:MAG: transcriptional regulator [Candidatus Kariarchaeaceae archaeon]